MSEELIKRLRFMGDPANGSIDHRTIREAADALSRPAPAVQVPTQHGARPVRFVCVNPLALTDGAHLPMFRDSWRFAFWEQDGQLCFGMRDDGPLVAYGAVHRRQSPPECMACSETWICQGGPGCKAGKPVAQGGGVDVEKVMALVRDYGRHCERYGHDGPMYEEIRALLTPATCKTSLQVDGWIPVPIEALQWLFGVHDDGFDWPNSNRLKYGFRSEFARRAGIDSVAVIDWKPAIANQEPQDGR